MRSATLALPYSEAAASISQGTPMDGKSVGRICLLYTSDAADERSSVDLGGRRIIKKKKRGDSCERVDELSTKAPNVRD